MLHPQKKQNFPGLPWVVQKYGGTSIGKFMENIASSIIPSFMETHRVAVVCSARSGEIKSNGTTTRLLNASEAALSQGPLSYLEIVKDIRNDHLSAAKLLIQDEAILFSIEKEINRECHRLGSFLQAAEIIGEMSPRSKDVIVSRGERLSCLLVAAVLNDRGIDTELIMLGDIVENSSALDQSFYDSVAKEMALRIHACGNKVPVLTGFFGNVPGSLLASMGRGYTDLCAALVAVGLGAQELQIWKEVDGIFTADPRKVKGARLLPFVRPEEVVELTYYGSEVIHAFTMEQVIRSHIPILIKNVQNPAGSGTRIFSDDSSPTRRLPTAVTVKENICVLNIHSNRKNLSHGFLAKIFGILDSYGIIVDLMSTSQVHVSIALEVETSKCNLDSVLVELETLGQVAILYNMAIISLVGLQMKNAGIAGKMFTCLSKANISVEIISQEASEINISCVVDQSNALSAMIAIHEDLLQEDSSCENGRHAFCIE
ncbi:Aspartate/glutamate/uridylate kinase [Spinellus fusiger]|nr:Aspartate/glutamate/uridylate kinase [Spinellus fusiger]